MKTTRIICSTIVVALSLLSEVLVSAATDGESILGIWTGRDANGEIGALMFFPDGNADFFRGDQSPRKAIIAAGGSVTYTYDPSTTPKSLDIIFTVPNGESWTLRGIVEFVGPDSIRFRSSRDGPRPSDFISKEGSTIVLKRHRRL